MSLDDFKGFGLFVLDCLRPRVNFGQGSRENKVAYLDGLRGFAALVVYWTHYTGFAHDGVWFFRNAYGWHDNYYFATLPFVRLLFHGGSFAVASFFVISGYVLSVSPLKMLHSQDQEGRLARQLGCSFPRRWVRLNIPVAGTTFIFFTLWHLLGISSAAAGNQGPRPNWFLELSRWLYEYSRASYVYNIGPGWGGGNYNTTLWSITAEFRGSTIIYVVLLAFLAMDYGPTQRFWSLIALFVYFLYIVDGTYFSLFIMGMLLCDLDLLAENDPFHLPKVLSHFKFMSKRRYLYYIPLIIGLFLCSAPHVQRIEELKAQPGGWSYLALLIPPTARNARWFLSAWGATFIVISIPRISWLRAFFESAFCQYLGKVSFGFYLVHGPVIWTVGDRLLAAVGRPHGDAAGRCPRWMDLFPMSDWGPLGLEISALAPQLILFPLTCYFAGVVTKLFDEPSVIISKRLFSPPSRK